MIEKELEKAKAAKLENRKEGYGYENSMWRLGRFTDSIEFLEKLNKEVESQSEHEGCEKDLLISVSSFMCFQYFNAYKKKLAVIQTQNERIALYERSLLFYADGRGYEAGVDMPAKVYCDGGETARKALGLAE